MTIRRRLLTAILLAGIPLLILQAYTIVHHYRSQKRLILEKEMETAQAMASLLEVGVGHLVQHHQMVARFVAQNPHRTREALAWVRESSPLVVRSGYVRPDGRVALLDPPIPNPERVNVLDRPYFQALLNGEDWAVSDLLISRAWDDPVVGVAIAVRNQRGALQGVLTSAIKPETLASLLRFRAEEGTYFGIVDSSGRLISSNLPQELPWAQRDWSKAPGLEKALAGTPTTVDDFLHPLEGTALMGAWVPVPALGWAVGVMDEIEHIMQPPQTAGLIQLGSLAFVVLLCLVTALRLAERLGRPIMRLAEKARRLGEGDFDQRVGVEGGDEAAVLGAAFNKMAEDIASSQATLTRQAEELARKASELQVLCELGRQLDSTLAVEELLETALAKVKELVGGDVALISIFDESRGRLVLRSHPRLPEASLQTMFQGQVDSWTTGQAARREEPFLVDRLPPQNVLSLATVLSGIASSVDVPLRAKGKAFGTLTLTSSKAGRFTERDVPFLSSVASVVAVAIDNARLYGEALDKTERLGGLIRTSAKVAGTLQVEDILGDIAEEAANLLGVEGAGFRLLEGDRLAVAGRYGLAHHLMIRPSLRVGESLSGRVAQEGRPISVSDLREDEGFVPEHQAAARFHGAVAYLGVPLRYRGGTIGVLNVFGKERRTFHEREVSLLSAFADHAAIALENARLYALSQRRLERARALHQTGQAISSTLDLPHLVDLILTKTAEHLKVSRCALHRTEIQGGTTAVTLQAGRGLSPGFTAGLQLQVGEGTTGKAVALRLPVWTADILTDPAIWLSPSLRARVEAEGYRAALSAPILVQGEPIGALAIYRDAAGPFEDEEVEFLQVLANQAGLAMRNARLFTELQGQTERLESLIRMSRLIGSSLELDQVLTGIVRTCIELLGMDAATLRVLNERTGTLESRVDHGLTDPQSRLRRSFGPGVGLIGRVLAERRVLTSANFAEDPRIENREWARAEGLVAAVGVPLFLGEKVLGTLALYKRSPREFSAADIALLSSFASHAAIAIQNARLYAQTKRDAETMTLLVRELDHRVRNNLSTIIGLLSMELGRKGYWTAEEALKACVDRVQSLAVIHDLLAQDKFKELDVKRLVEAVAEAAVRGFTWGKEVEIEVDAPPLRLPPKWLSALGLVTNELITNALKHGLPRREAGRIEIQVKEGQEEVRLEVRDNGVGVPTGRDRGARRGGGLDIVAALVETDLRGEFHLRNEGGTVASIRFPKPQAAEV